MGLMLYRQFAVRTIDLLNVCIGTCLNSLKEESHILTLFE